MKIAKRLMAAMVLVLLAGLAAPYISADSYGARLRASLERALGRRVELRGGVHFNLFHGPGFSAGNVVIHEDPAIGFEPMAYVDSITVRPAFLPLLAGRFVIASIRLDDATLNLAKSQDVWNFASFMNRSVMSATPAIHVRNGRINFKSGLVKSIFYLMNADLDIAPPHSSTGGWEISCEAEAARTDKRALGLGAFSLQGKWFVRPERVDLDFRFDRTQLGDFAALMSGQAGGIHGTISTRLHLAGPIDGIGILGRLTVEDVHRWDLLPPKGQGWPVDIRGRLNMVAQQLELQSTSSVIPVTARFRASEYLSHPRWAVTLTWNQLPFAPVLQLTRDMGAQLPPKLKVTGTIDGAIGYSGQSGWQGELALHDTAVALPDAPELRFEQMHVTFDRGHVRLAPAVARTVEQEEFRLEAAYSLADDSLDLAITTEEMSVESLRAQAALAAVPWLEQVTAGHWRGQLRYRRDPDEASWTGNIELADAEVAVPGLADPLEIAIARVRIDGERVAIDKISARAGKLAFMGEYRYEPGVARPHRLRVSADKIDAADLEAELMPTLRRNRSLIARVLGRSAMPAWLRERKLEGSVQIGDLELAGTHVSNIRARLIWDVTRVNLAALNGTLGGASFDGSLMLMLSSARPAYKLTGKLKGLSGQLGALDAEGTLETAGIGPELLARLRLTDLSLRTGDDLYTGSGAIQDDGRLLIVLTNGIKEMRMSGTLAELKMDAEADAGEKSQE